jgi:hypothetical protein
MSNPFRLKRIGGGSTLRGGDGLRGRQGIFPSGSLAASGALIRNISTSLTGAISTLTGTVTKLVSPTAYTGAISTLTSTLTNYKVIVLELASGISTITSSLQTQINLSPIGGTIATAGSLVKSLALNVFTGAISTLTGSLVRVRQVFSTFTSSIGLAGAFQANINLVLTGTIASAGSLIKNLTLTAFTGAISTLTSSLASLKISFLEVAGVISTISGAFQSNINLALTGTIVGAGNLIKSISTNYTGAISTLIGAVTRTTFTSFTGSISTLVGSLTKISYLNNLVGVIVTAGALTKEIFSSFSGAVSTLTGALTKLPKITLAGIISTITSVGTFERITPPATMILLAVSNTTMTLTAVSGTTITIIAESDR